MVKEEKKGIYKTLQVDRLLKLVKLQAIERHSGDFTVFSFGSGYKAVFGIQHYGLGELTTALGWIPGKMSLKQALIHLLLNEYDFHSLPSDVHLDYFFNEIARDGLSLAIKDGIIETTGPKSKAEKWFDRILARKDAIITELRKISVAKNFQNYDTHKC